jgi:nitrate/nitrite transporter NarK
MVVGYVMMAAWAIPLFLLVDTANLGAFTLAVFVLAVALGLSYGPQSAMFAELFPPRIRYTAASLPYAIGGIVGGGFAPAISEWLIETTGTSLSISVYLIVFVAISLASLAAMRQSDFTGFADDDRNTEQHSA